MTPRKTSPTRGLVGVAIHGLFASLNSLAWCVETRVFQWLLGRQPLGTLEVGDIQSMMVKVDLDLGDQEQQMHVISLPVDLWEYPDVLRARSLAVRLEMVAHEGNGRTMRCVHLRSERDTLYPTDLCNCGIPAYRRSLDLAHKSRSQTTRPQTAQ